MATSKAPSVELHQCASCRNEASKACTGCKNAPTLTGSYHTIYYCSVTCQKNDWANHRTVCKQLRARKLLYKAGTLLQGIFYVYREHLFDRPYQKVEQKDDKLLLHDAERDHSAFQRTVFDILVPFPDHLCNSLEDKQAMLSHMSCSDAVAWLHDIVGYVLKDECSSIAEVELRPMNHKRECVAVSLGGEEIDHSTIRHLVWEITLKSGAGTFVLDLAGAQFGYHEPVTPYEPYMEARMKSYVFEMDPSFGTLKKEMTAIWESGIHNEEFFKNNAEPILSLGVNIQMYEALKQSIVDWEESENTTVKAMLELPDPKFQQVSSKIFERVSEGLKLRRQKCELDLSGGGQ